MLAARRVLHNPPPGGLQLLYAAAASSGTNPWGYVLPPAGTTQAGDLWMMVAADFIGVTAHTFGGPIPSNTAWPNFHTWTINDPTFGDILDVILDFEFDTGAAYQTLTTTNGPGVLAIWRGADQTTPFVISAENQGHSTADLDTSWTGPTGTLPAKGKLLGVWGLGGYANPPAGQFLTVPAVDLVSLPAQSGAGAAIQDVPAPGAMGTATCGSVGEFWVAAAVQLLAA